MPNAISPSPFLSPAMLAAIKTARQWLGATYPNPPVGAVALDKNGIILASAAHQRAGSNHAETALLQKCHQQNLLSQIDTICVTLEPCNHFGRTPPCTEAIIAAGVRRVVVGTRDPNPHVTGGGMNRLRQAGVEIIEDIEAESCRQLIHSFAFRTLMERPFVTVKRAINQQGSMLPPKGQKTFTSHESLILSHRLRKKADAIVTGSGTIIADNPLFTVRHVPDYPNKRRILAILDRHGRVSEDYIQHAARRGLDVIIHSTLDSCFSDLCDRGMQDILVESGPTLSQLVLNSSFWTMLIDIHQSESDKVKVSFNPAAKVPFNTDNISLGNFLPAERTSLE